MIAVDRAWGETRPFVTISADLYDLADGRCMMIEQASNHGPVEALVHLVGGFRGGQPVAETSDQTWDLMMNVNLRIAFNDSRGARSDAQ